MRATAPAPRPRGLVRAAVLGLEAMSAGGLAVCAAVSLGVFLAGLFEVVAPATGFAVLGVFGLGWAAWGSWAAWFVAGTRARGALAVRDAGL